MTWIVEHIFLVPEKKISKLRSSVTSMVAAGSCSARQLASVVGRIISISLAIGLVARLCTHSMYDLLTQVKHGMSGEA